MLTILEHFENAKREGLEWAETAFMYRAKDITDEYLNGVISKPKDLATAETLKRALGAGFFWKYTKEGYAYWCEIYDNLPD